MAEHTENRGLTPNGGDRRLVRRRFVARPGADDPLRQAEARAYQRPRRRIGLASNVVDLAALVAIVAATGASAGRWALALLVAGLLLLGLPFGLAGYRLSRAYGLSRQTTGGWLADRLKGAGVGLVLGGAARRRAARHPARRRRLVAAARRGSRSSRSARVLAALWPVLLLPIFLRSEPMAPGRSPTRCWDTARRGERARARAAPAADGREDRRRQRDGRRASGPTVRIYVSDTLAEAEEGEDDDGASRARGWCSPTSSATTCTTTCGGCMAVSAATLAAGHARGVGGGRGFAPDGAGHLSTLPALVLGFSLASAVVSPLGAAYSRRRERAADAYAAALAGEGETFARAFERLVARNLSELSRRACTTCSPSSHPTPAERIAVARAGGVPAENAPAGRITLVPGELRPDAKCHTHQRLPLFQ